MIYTSINNKLPTYFVKDWTTRVEDWTTRVQEQFGSDAFKT